MRHGRSEASRFALQRSGGRTLSNTTMTSPDISRMSLERSRRLIPCMRKTAVNSLPPQHMVEDGGWSSRIARSPQRTAS